MKIGVPSVEKNRAARCAGVAAQTAVAAVAAVLHLAAWSQSNGDTAAKPGISVVPRLSVTETYSNNVSLRSTGQQREFTTQLSPGISINSRAGRIKGTFNYSLNELLYANNTSARQSQNALSTSGVVEALDNFAFIDFSGNISQQTISAFGTQSTNSAAINGNSTETSTYSLSPYIRGRLGGFADYVARYSWTTTSSGSVAASDSKTKNVSFNLNGATSGPLGWSAAASSQTATYSLGQPVKNSSLGGTLLYSFSPQVNVSLIASRESNNYTTVSNQSYNSAGMGLNWAISERTRVAAQFEHHSYGQSHTVSFSHRTARTAWSFSDSQGVSTTPAQSGATVGSLADLLYGQFAALQPDPVLRANLVNQFLQDYGLRGNTPVISNFLASSVSLQRRQDLSFALLGVRDTVSFALTRGSNSQLSNFANAFTSLANSSVVNQTGLSVSYAHRLTQELSLNMVAARQNTSGDAGLQSTSLRSFNVTLSGQVGRQMFASIGARRVFFESSTTPYTESAVIGNLNLQF